MTDFGQRPRQLLKTGQTTSYVTGDDGDLQKGLARSYTILTTGQHAGSTDITINAKTHSLSNNVVQDNSTALMWARYVPDDDIGPDNNGKLLWTDDVNSEDVFEFFAQANANRLGGYTDWRLANDVELRSLIDSGNYYPSINTTAFPSTPTDSFWTSNTRSPAAGANAWYIRFTDGFQSYAAKTITKYYCRLVRGGP